MNRKIILLLFFSVIPIISFSQEKDFGIWMGATAKHSFSKKLDADFSAELRSFNNATQVDQDFLEASLSYDLGKIFSVSGSYRFINTLERDDQYHIRHKLFADVNATIPIRKLKIATRLRLQRTTRNFVEKPKDELAKYVTRFKLKAEYDFLTLPLDPFVSAEGFFPVSAGNGFEISKSRLSVGTSVKISLKSRIEIGYIYEQDKIPNPINSNIVSVNYSLKF